MSAIATLARVVRPAVRAFPRCTQLASFAIRFNSSYPPHTVINMPALSPTMTQGNLVVWNKSVGDEMAPGESIAEIETDKAQMDFEFQEEGFLAKILVEDGTKNVLVNTPIAVYVEDASDVGAFKDFTVDSTSKKPAATEAPKEEAKQEAKEEIKQEPTPAPAPTATKSTKSTSSSTSVNRIFASPLAKTIALDKGISLKNIKGSGPNGRIIKEDVEKAVAAAESAAASVPPAGQNAAPAAAADYVDVPITNMRSIIGQRLLESTQTNPSYIVSSQISVSKLLKLRASLNASANDRYKLSINDILIKAIAAAARRVPDANSHWLEAENVIRQYNNVDVSVAVATPTGLITPIVKNAHAKGLADISKEVKDLGKRAKENKLKPEEFQGGTICISNLGMNPAVNFFTSIINPPQSTILAIGTVKRVAVEDKAAEHGFSFDSQISITGTFDHRVVDGAKGGEFIKALKDVIENPLELLL